MRAAFAVLIVLAGVACAREASADAVARAARPPKPRWLTCPMPPAMPAADAHGTVTVDGADIYYAIYGTAAPDTAPVVLLHGGLGNSDHWANQVPALAAKYQVVAIDSRGQGRSTRTTAPVSYEVMANDVLAVMDKLAIKRAALVGWSDGGEIALKLAITHPDRVARLFVFGTNYDASGSKPRGGAPTATFNAYAARSRADYAKLSKTPRQFDQLVEWLLPIWKSPMGFTKDQLRAIEAPTLIGDGDHDEIIQLAQVQEMAQLIPHAKLAVLADTSHFALWQDPTDFNAVLLDFLAGT